MVKRPAIPINVLPEALFAPANGTHYADGDISRIFAQQPFKGPLPARYLIPSPTTTLRPPKLRYGWRLGHDKLMDIAHKHFKEAVQYRFAPATENLDEDDETEYSPEDYKEEKANIIETILGPDYIIAIQDLLGLPDWSSDYVTIQPLFDSELNSEWGLTVGSNYPPGILKRELIAKLEEILETDEPVMWYLDFDEWQWHRLPSLPKPSRSKPKPKATTKSSIITQAVQAPKTIAPESAPGSMMEQAENTQL